MSMGEELNIEWLLAELSAIWLPLWVGSLTIGITLGILAFTVIHIAWRTHVATNWQRRKRNRAALKENNND